MRILSRIIVTVLFLFAFIISLQPQAYGQAPPPTNFLGTVTDSQGRLLKGAEVTVIPDKRPSLTITAKTDGFGRFEIPNLEPGLYSVTISAEGFVHTSTHLQVIADQIISEKFTLNAFQGPVPINAPSTKPLIPANPNNPAQPNTQSKPGNQKHNQRPSPNALQEEDSSTRPFEVEEQVFNDDVSVQEWLNKIGDEGKYSVMGILPFTKTTTLIVLEPVEQSKSRYMVTRVSGQATKEDVKRRINLSHERFIGLVYPDNSSYLIVYRYEAR